MKKIKGKVRWAEEPKAWKEKHQYINCIYTAGGGDGILKNLFSLHFPDV